MKLCCKRIKKYYAFKNNDKIVSVEKIIKVKIIVLHTYGNN